MLSRKYNILILMLIQLVIGCKQKQSNSECGEVSTRIMHSILQLKVQAFKQHIHSANNKIENFNNIFLKLEDVNNQLIVLAGGFKSGKNLKMIEPCRYGEKNSVPFKNNNLEKTYLELVDQFVSTGMIDDRDASNMRFTINSYFCKENCVFSDSNLNQSPIGLLLLNNLILQFTLLELVKF